MMIRKVNFSKFAKRFIDRTISRSLINTKSLFIQQQNSISQPLYQHRQKYEFSTQKGQKQGMSQNMITMAIQQAKSTQQLHSIFQTHKKLLNFIHRTVLLQKVTQRPFDKDEQLIYTIIDQIKAYWKYDYPLPSQKNSRAIANTICYMSRKVKYHDLDEQFATIDFFQLAKFINPKEFVMMFNGLLKLELLDKLVQNNPGFKLDIFLTENINENFIPSLLVSMWFNIIKYQKSSSKINDFFANLLKNKHFKNNLIDYMQIVFCYVNSEGNRSVDLTYPVMTHPKQLTDGKGYLGAHELSVLYEQLGKLKKIKDVYFSDQFNELLQSCFTKILNQKDIPLRNVANVFVNMTQYENPTGKMLDTVYYKYYTVLKNQITLLERLQPNKKFRANVDPLSFVTLFEQLLANYHKQNTYLKELASISLTYVQKIIQHKIIADYNEKTFVRLLSGLELAKKMIEQRNPGQKFEPNMFTKGKLEEQIMKRGFNEVASLGKLIGFVYNMEIRQRQICQKLKKMIQSIPKQNQVSVSYQERLKQPCILNKNCKNCRNCFSS